MRKLLYTASAQGLLIALIGVTPASCCTRMPRWSAHFSRTAGRK